MFDLLRKTFFGAAVAVALTISGGASEAATFTFSNGGGNGTGTDLGSGFFEFGLQLSSNNNGTGGIFTTWTETAASAITVFGTWDYSTQDVGGSTFDTLGYFIDDVLTTLVQLSVNGDTPPADQDGTYSFTVLAGQDFGFYMLATDGILGGASATIFGDTSPVPLPAGGLLLIGALGGLAALRRRKLAA